MPWIEETHFWIDPDFLYRVNYGPMTPRDFSRLKWDFSYILYRDFGDGAIFLDRILAAKLQSAVFSYVSSLRIDQDYSKAMKYPVMWAENFVLRYVWNEDYSSSVLGVNSRPPMAAVISDMLAMISFFKSSQTSHPKSVIIWLKEFFDS